MPFLKQYKFQIKVIDYKILEKVSINTDIIYEKFKRENIFDLSNKKSIVYIS